MIEIVLHRIMLCFEFNVSFTRRFTQCFCLGTTEILVKVQGSYFLVFFNSRVFNNIDSNHWLISNSKEKMLHSLGYCGAFFQSASAFRKQPSKLLILSRFSGLKIPEWLLTTLNKNIAQREQCRHLLFMRNLVLIHFTLKRHVKDPTK